MRTPICDHLGIEFPIVAFSHCRDVVAAVSRAGGFGVLGAVAYDPDELRVALRWIEEQVGERPYGIDVLVPARVPGDPEEQIPAEHRRFVDDLLDRYGVPPLLDDGEGPSPLSRQLSERSAQLLAEVALEHRPALIASALGPPPPELVSAAHDREVLVAALVGTEEHARRQVAAGVDIIVAQGYEAGGHTGDISTMVLVPQVVDAVAPRPVLAAGGIARGRQVAAALALGAQGVWTGSVWLTTREAETHPAVMEKLLAATSSDTVRSRSWSGKPVRQLRSAWTDEWAAPEAPEPLPMPYQTILIDTAQARIARAAAAAHPGACRLINYFVGQVVGSLDRVEPADRVLYRMVEEWIDVTEQWRTVDVAPGQNR